MGRRNDSGKHPQPARQERDGARERDDAQLFRDAIGPVRELPAAPPPPDRPRPRPAARMAERDEAEARSEFARLLDADRIEGGDVLRYRRDEIPAHVLRRLRRGHYAAQDELDLHGADGAIAERLLREFLREAVRAGLGCVRIVHGKGLGSKGLGTGGAAPVLKNLVDRQLRRRSDVLAFHSAPPAQGGTGAVLVLLRRAV